MATYTDSLGPLTSTWFGIRTAMLYGVFVTEKSYLIGLRKLLVREHTRMLTSKICGNSFPQEIIDLIEQSLYEMQRVAIELIWKADQPFDWNAHILEDRNAMLCPAQKAVRARLAATRVKFGPVSISVPSVEAADIDAERYVHLCASDLPPMSMSLPPDSVAYTDVTSARPQRSTEYKSSHGQAFVQCWPHSDHILSGDYLRYVPSGRNQGGKPSKESMSSVHRLLQGMSIEESVRHWDQGALKTYVDMLQLEPVSFSGGDPLKPTLHISQEMIHNDANDYRLPRKKRGFLAATKQCAKQKQHFGKLRVVKRWLKTMYPGRN